MSCGPNYTHEYWREEKLASVILQPEGNISTSREEAAAAVILTGKVDRMEAVSLYYAACELYDVMTTLESAFDDIPKEKTVALFDTLKIADIIHHLRKKILNRHR